MQSAITNPLDTAIFREVEIESEVYEYWLQLLEVEGATVYQQQFSFWHYHRVA